MTSFTLNDATYFLPSTWDEVTFDQYASIVEFQQGEQFSAQDKAARILATLTHLPLATIEETEFGVVVPLFQHLSFLSQPPQPVPTQHVVIAGIPYYSVTIEKFGELAAFDRVNAAFADQPLRRLPYLLAILLRRRVEVATTPPATPWYRRVFGTKTPSEQPAFLTESFENDSEWVEKRAKLFNHGLNPAQVMGLAAFFLSSARLSATVTRCYSSAHATAVRLNALLVSKSGSSTAGWRPSSIWSRMLQSMLRSWLSRSIPS